MRAVKINKVPTAAWVATGLVAGFGLAQATYDLVGNRSVGAVALAGCGVIAGLRWAKTRGPVTTIALTVVYLGVFGGSHALAKHIGAWPSVFTAAGVAAAVTWFVADRPVRKALNRVEVGQ